MNNLRNRIILIVVMTTTLWGCFHSRHIYLVGYSDDESITIENAIHKYLDAKCKGNDQVIEKMSKKKMLRYCLKHELIDKLFEPLPVACDLKVDKVYKEKQNHNRVFFGIYYYDKSNTANRYYSSFIAEDKHLFIQDYLEPVPDLSMPDEVKSLIEKHLILSDLKE